MKKELIQESAKMQKLAGIITESEYKTITKEEQGYKNMDDDWFEDEEQSEDPLDEMARTAGTGGAFTITKEGEDVLRQVKATREIPEGLRSSMIAILIWLFKAKKEGKRVQKKTYADERGVPQPAVNPLFNKLLEKGLVSMEGYTPKGSASPGTKSNVSPEELDGLELDEVLDRIIERTE